MNDKLKAVLIALGMTASAVTGAFVSNIGEEPNKEGEPIVIEAPCEGESLVIEKDILCLDKLSYDLVKSSLADKYSVNGAPDLNELPLYIAVIDNEIKKQGGEVQVNGEITFESLVNQYLK